MQMAWEEAAEKGDKATAEVWRKRLHIYLDWIFLKDSVAAAPFHGLQASAIFATLLFCAHVEKQTILLRVMIPIIQSLPNANKCMPGTLSVHLLNEPACTSLFHADICKRLISASRLAFSGSPPIVVPGTILDDK